MADHVQANLTVQEAYNRAKSTLEGGAPDRAIAIGQHILRYYPRYFDAYRLLGEAYLERGQADEAFRLFTHVLQVDPQNVLGHIGRAIIAEERGEIDAAIDEYERAFEVDPSIPELRGELLRLYKERDGSASASIRTTPSGLAYVHLRAGLRDAAISEFSTAAQLRPDRWDLEVALAEALWRNEQLDEAAAIAGDILAGHPSCAKCNWMLGYIHWTSGRTDSGRKYLLDAVSLDPTYAIATKLWENTPWPLDRNLTRPQPALIPGWSGADLKTGDLNLEAASIPSTPVTRPLDGRRITQKFETAPLVAREPVPTTAPLAAEAVAPPSTPVEAAAPAEAAVAAEEAAPAPLDLDWFDDWADAAESAPVAAAPEAPAEASVSSPVAAAPEAPAAEAGASSPVDSVAPETAALGAEASAEPPATGPAMIAPTADEFATPTLYAPDEEVVQAAHAPEAEASGLPSWLDTTPETIAPATAASVAAGPENAAATPPAEVAGTEPLSTASEVASSVSDLPDWLESPSETAGPLAEAPVATDAASIAGSPVVEAKGTESAQAAQAPAVEASILLSWLDSPPETIVSITAEAPAAPEAPSPTATEAEAVESASPAQVPAVEASALPSWLESPPETAPPAEAAPAPGVASAEAIPATEGVGVATAPVPAATDADTTGAETPVPPAEREDDDFRILPSAPMSAADSARAAEPGQPAEQDDSDFVLLQSGEPDQAAPPAAQKSPAAPPVVAEDAAPVEEAAPPSIDEPPGVVALAPTKPPLLPRLGKLAASQQAVEPGPPGLPAWLENLAAQHADRPAAGAPPGLPAWVDSAPTTPGADAPSAPPEMPTWLEAPPAAPPTGAAAAPPSLPAWLDSLPDSQAMATQAAGPPPEPAETPAPATESEANAFPAWLAGLSDTSAGPTEAPTAPGPPQADAEPSAFPDWLAHLTDSMEVPTDPADTAPATPTEAEAPPFPTWLAELRATSAGPTEVPDTTEAAPADAIPGAFPDWLANLSDSGAAPAPPDLPFVEPEAGAFPAWLTGLSDSSVTPPASVEGSQAGQEPLPTGLTDAGGGPAEEPAAPALPSWMEALTANAPETAGDIPRDEQAEMPAPAPPVYPVEDAGSSALPSWLEGLEVAPPAAEVSAREAESVAPTADMGDAGAPPVAAASDAPALPDWLSGDTVLPPTIMGAGVPAPASEHLMEATPPDAAAPPPPAVGVEAAEAPPVELAAEMTTPVGASAQVESAAPEVAAETVTPVGASAQVESAAPELPAETLASPADVAAAEPGSTHLAAATPAAVVNATEPEPGQAELAAGAPAEGSAAAEPAAAVLAADAPSTAVSATEIEPGPVELVAAAPAEGSAVAEPAPDDQFVAEVPSDSPAVGQPAGTVDGSLEEHAGSHLIPAPAPLAEPEPVAEGLGDDGLQDWLARPAINVAQGALDENPVGGVETPAPTGTTEAAAAHAEAEKLADENFFEWIGRTTPQPDGQEHEPAPETAAAGPSEQAAGVARPVPAQAPSSEPEPVAEGPGDHELQDWLAHPAPQVEREEPDATVAATEPESSHNSPEVSYNQSTAPEAGDPVRAEEDTMAPSYKEDDDQERQFDFDWDHEALPDYLKPFLMDDATGAPPVVPPAPPAPGPGPGFAPQGGFARPTPPAPAAGPAPAGFSPAQPAPFGPVGSADDLDLSGIQPFDFGAAGGGGGNFDFGGNGLPNWLGSAGGAPPPEAPLPSRPMAADETQGPDLDNPGLPDWLRTPAAEAASAPAPPAPSSEFDFGGDALPSWLPAASAPPAPGADLGGMAPFNFQTPSASTPPASDYDFGGIQPFDFGAALGGPPSAPVPSTPPAAGSTDQFDFGGFQPFDFGAGEAPVAQEEPAPEGGSDDYDFIEFLSATMESAAPAPGTPAPAPAPAMAAQPAPAAPVAPGEFDFDLPDIQPFSLEGLDLSAPAGPSGLGGMSASPSPVPATPAPLPTAGPPPARPRPVPLVPEPEEITGFAPDEFNFEPFMFDEGGLGGDTFQAPPSLPPIPSGLGALSAPPAPPRVERAAGPAETGSALPPGLEGLPDLQPFAFDGEGLDTGGLGPGFETSDQERAFGRRATDRESGRTPVPFSFEEESVSPVGDVHSFSWQRRGAASRPAPAPIEPDEAGGSIFAKAKKRKEELEQARRREADVLPEAAAPAPIGIPTSPEEAEEIANWPTFDEDDEVVAAASQVQSPDFVAISGSLEQDMADLQLTPFSFEEEPLEAESPLAGFAPSGLPAPVPFDAAALGQAAAAAPPPSEVPSASPAETGEPGELLWSIPVTEPSATAPQAGGLGAEIAPGEFDFSGLQPFDLGALELTPEERAYLMGGQEGGSPEMGATGNGTGIPELPLGADFSAGPPAPADIQPFSFDATVYQAPPEGAPFEAEAAEAPTGFQPFDASAFAVPPQVEPFDAGELNLPAQVEPFDASAFAVPPQVEPFDMSSFGLPGEAEPFDASAFAVPPQVEPFDMSSFGLPGEAEPFDASAFAVPPQVAPAEAGGVETIDFANAPAEPAPVVPAVDESFSIPEAFGAPGGEVSPVAAESWSETPLAERFDFSDVEMAPLETETVAAAPSTPVAAAPEAPAPVPATPVAPAEEQAAPPAPAAPPTVEDARPVAVPPAPAVLEAPAAPAPVVPQAPPAPVPAMPATAASAAPAGGSIEDLVRYLDATPDDAAARLALAIGYEQRDDYGRAADQYRQLIKGRNVPANVLDIVAGNLRELVESQPDDPALHRLLGDAYMKQGQFQMAISQYNWLLTKGAR